MFAKVKFSFLMVIICIKLNILYSQIIYCESYKQIHAETKRDLNRIKKTNLNRIIFENVNLLWPDCVADADKFVDPQKIQNHKLYLTQDWLTPLNDCVIGNWGSFNYYQNMRNGDDWIIACSDRCGVFAQVIDGRTTTVLIKQSIYKKTTDSIEIALFPFLDKFIQRRGYNLLAPKITVIKKDSIETIGVIDEEDIKILEKDILMYKVIFWFDTSYTIVDIIKNRDPLKKGNRLSILGTATVGGILRNDPRSFKRFEGDVIDYKKETFKQFPWLIDTIVNNLRNSKDEYM